MVEVYDNKYRELMANALNELRTTTDITQLTPGAKARALLEIAMRELGNAYNIFSKDMLKAFLPYATGADLDLIGELMGLTRRPASRNELTGDERIQKFYVEGGGTFGSINGGVNFTIPAGAEVYTKVLAEDEEAKTYIISEDLVCQTADTVAYAAIRSREFGTVGNVGAGTLVLHNFENYSDYLNDTLKTINIEGVAYAEDAESDANYRFRLTNQTLESELANYVAVRMAALNTPGVADVLMDEYSRGIGTGAVYIKAVTPTVSEFLLSEIQLAVDKVKAYGSFIEARAPKDVGVEMVLTLTLYKTMTQVQITDLGNRVRDHIYQYINGLDINESLEVDLLVREILSVDSNIRRVGTIQQPIDELYVWKYSAAEDNRVRQAALDGYTASNFERVVIEYTELIDGQDPIAIRTS